MITPRMKASVDVEGAGVDAEAGCTGAEGAVAGAEDVSLVSGTGIAADLWALGTLAKHLWLSCPSSPACHPAAAPQLTESQLP